MILISEIATLDFGRLRDIIVRVFEMRATHELPSSLPDPPKDWSRPYRKLASEVGQDPDALVGHRQASAFLQPILCNEPGFQTWDPERREWREAK